MSVFTISSMRKNINSAMDEHKSVAYSVLDNVNMHAIDGAHLLHAVEWGIKPHQTYQDICNKYVAYWDIFFSTVIVFLWLQ